VAEHATVDDRNDSKGARERAPIVVAALFGLLGVAVGTFFAWENAIWPLNQDSGLALERRAQQFWDLKAAGDTLGAYGYMTESYRRRVTPAGFGRVGQGLVIHTGATVRDVVIEDDGTVARVEIDLRHRFNRKNFNDMETVSAISERWVLENGTWYRWPFGLRG